MPYSLVSASTFNSIGVQDWQINPNSSLVRGFDGFVNKLHASQAIINRREVVLIRIQRGAVDVFADGFDRPQ